MKTILVAEDDPINMQLTSDYLQFNGFNVLKCSDGKDALEALKQTTPDLIILDMNMPGLNGFEVFKLIKQDNSLKGIKVVAVSASVMKEDEKKVRLAGFDDFIPKPYDLKSFLVKIKNLSGE
ncbi:MAG: response regulator [Candidatus Omnitrophica bacterium]|nr:response regulator [Candidatus Omnitrophota bacterium]